MADYEISARIVAEDATDAGSRDAERRLDRVERKGVSVGSSISRALAGAFAAVGGTYALSQFLGGVVSVNSELESAQANLASLFSATFGMGIEDSMRAARQQLQGLREDAAAGVGELSNYAEAFQLLLSPVTGAGGSLEDVRRLTRESLTAGFAVRGVEGLQQAPLDIAQALQQGVSGTVTPIVAAALRAAKISEQSFNAADTAARMDMLFEAFGRYSGAVEIMGGTWEAQMATMQDGLRELFRTLTQPLFERWSEQLQAANTWLASNQDRVTELLTSVGTGLVRAWDHVIANLRTYIALLGAAAVAQQTGLAGQLAGAAASRGGAVLTAGRQFINDPLAMGGIVGNAGAAAGLGRSAMAAGGFGPLAAAIGALAGPLAIATGLFLAVKGAMEEDLFGVMSGLVLPALQALAQAGGQLWAALGGLLEVFTGINAEGSLLNVVGAYLLSLFGVMVLALTGLVKILTAAVYAVSALSEVLVGFVQALGLAVRGDLGGAREVLQGALGGAGDSLGAAVDVLAGDSPVVDMPTAADVEEEFANNYGQNGQSSGPTQPGSVVNIGTVNVEARTEVNEDPARVADAFREVLTKTTRYKLSPLLKR